MGRKSVADNNHYCHYWTILRRGDSEGHFREAGVLDLQRLPGFVISMPETWGSKEHEADMTSRSVCFHNPPAEATTILPTHCRISCTGVWSFARVNKMPTLLRPYSKSSTWSTRSRQVTTRPTMLTCLGVGRPFKCEIEQSAVSARVTRLSQLNFIRLLRWSGRY